MKQSVESNYVEKFKAIASTANTSPIFQIFFKKVGFSENLVNLDMEISFNASS